MSDSQAITELVNDLDQRTEDMSDGDTAQGLAIFAGGVLVEMHANYGDSIQDLKEKFAQEVADQVDYILSDKERLN